ncbi:MAG: AbrB family transcriptional regulator [Pseudomonadota bacterium]
MTGRWAILLQIALIGAVGASGAALFMALGLPAAALTGSALAMAAGVAMGLRGEVPRPLRSVAFVVLGVVIGAAMTPEAAATLLKVPLAMVALAVVMVVSIAASTFVLHRLGGWDRVTALCSSIPGALQVTLVVSAHNGANMERVVIAQSLRLLLLVSAIPLLFGGEGAALPGDGAGVVDTALTLLLVVGCVVVFSRVPVPSALVIGPMVLSAVLSVTGALTIAVPHLIASAAFVTIGATVALRFQTVTAKMLREALGLSLLAFVVAAAVTLIGSLLTVTFVDEPLGAVFLAFAPGGVDAMLALAYLLALEVEFVAALHVARLLAISVLAPSLVAWWARR